jgi:predicted double-glycine peptidase
MSLQAELIAVIQEALARADEPAEEHGERIPVPSVQQQTGWTCGPAALMAVTRYFQVFDGSEADMIALLQSTPEGGTPPDHMVAGTRKLGLEAWGVRGMTIDQLEEYLEDGYPVIVCLQAWGSPEGYEALESGHWVVAMGAGEDRIYFEDPELEPNERGYIPREEFDHRWQDKDEDGKLYYHYGIVFKGARWVAR